MAHVNNARQWQRFAYSSEVQLAVGSEPMAAPLLTTAACLDLSLGGVQLLAPSALAVGAPVSCMFPGGHDELHLPGYVRWSAKDIRFGSPQASRVGIEFAPLSAAGRQALQALLSQVQRAGEIMRVHLPSFNEPLLGVAVSSERGVHLHVPLPFFVSGSVIRFAPLAGGGSCEGRVLGTQLCACPETQALELDLLLEPCRPARKRRYMMYENTGAGHEARAASRLETIEIRPLVVPKTRTNRVLAATAVLGCALWLLAAKHALPWQHRPTRSTANAAGESARKRPRNTAVNAWGTARTPTPAITASTAQVIPPHPTELSDGSGLRSHTAVREQPAEEKVPPRSGADLEHSETAAPALDAAEPARLPAQPSVIQPNRELNATSPHFTSSGDTSELFVPVTGSLTGLRAAVWVDPPALALDMPRGRITLPRTRYEIHEGGVQGLSFGRPHNVTQLRVYLTAPLTRYTTTEAPGGVTIRMKRNERSQR